MTSNGNTELNTEQQDCHYDIDTLRKSVINFVSKIVYNVCNMYNLNISEFNNCIPNDTPSNVYEFHVSKFEQDLFNSITTYNYIMLTPNKLHNMVTFQNGLFPDDITIIQYITKKITILDLLNMDTTIVQDCKKEMIQAFIKLIYKYCKDRNLVQDISTKIEMSCFNAIIKNSKHLEDPPCRQWSSPVFKEMYSNRCGIILNLLNPKSSTNKIYNSDLLNRVLSGSIDPKTIGCIPERQLCPQALQKEKNEIELRSEQHLIEKESNLFKCPNCKERKVTYREVQLRSIDEAPDYLCKCLNCKHRFKGH
jgi:DNA-directed RNA polymerase subunit M/transcription elongation factor TFIIS